MTNKTQIRTKRISFVLALSVITYTATDTYLSAYHDIDVMNIMTPVIIGLAATIILCGTLQRSFYKWMTKYSINLSFAQQSPIVLEADTEIKTDCANEIQTIEQPSVLDNYDTMLENFKKKEAERQVKIMDATLEPAERLRRFLKVLLINYEVPISDTVWNRIPLDLTNEQYGAVVNLTRVSVSRIFSDWISKDLLYKSGRNVYVKAKLFENIYDWWTD